MKKIIVLLSVCVFLLSGCEYKSKDEQNIETYKLCKENNIPVFMADNGWFFCGNVRPGSSDVEIK